MRVQVQVRTRGQLKLILVRDAAGIPWVNHRRGVSANITHDIVSRNDSSHSLINDLFQILPFFTQNFDQTVEIESG